MLLVLVGSVSDGSTAALARALATLTDAQVEVWMDLSSVPLFAPGAAAAPSVEEIRERIAAADGVVVVTPEYAYGMPGALKNVLDWLVGSGELYRTPVVAVSASPSERGGDRALASLGQTLEALGADVRASLAVPFVRQVLDADGEVEDEAAERLRTALGTLG